MATLVEIAAQLVSSHASSTPMTSDELLAEIAKVHAALKNLEAGQAIEGVEETRSSVSVKEAFKKNEVVCLICGKGGFKTLARHLSTAHGMKPGAYKKQFGISSKQALSAKSYSEARRKMAQDRGLADNLAKAREVRMANIEAKKEGVAKPVKPAKAAKPAKAPAKAAKAPAKTAAAPKAAKAKTTAPKAKK
ncbi:MucR family transcriptional regulator [Geomonas subterranea]|uniref:MucR family transcriptional regulator n=1 Tax=Geomonas subterranea TaxID=2847989 RepID=A0ABX8LJB9_9BACT|nr:MULTISPECIES: MucR family transcriptional regulator [Geomonas]QXE92121.1 MucR family transcriptional regulator [Geomonas subterranea]QXM09783.1 MucR family transcriptional regulator [Geomonas subterranea]